MPRNYLTLLWSIRRIEVKCYQIGEMRESCILRDKIPVEAMQLPVRPVSTLNIEPGIRVIGKILEVTILIFLGFAPILSSE